MSDLSAVEARAIVFGAVADTPSASPEELYAGFWRRVAAFVIDYALVAGVVIALTLVLTAIPVPDATVMDAFPLLLVGVYWMYQSLTESSAHQATLGKRALRIKVTDYSGGRLDFSRATARYFAKYVSLITYGIGFLMAGFTKRRRALHDMMAGTLVVRKSTSPENLAADSVGRPMSESRTVLISVLGALIGVGLFAASAIPKYQMYLTRSQVSQALTAASTYQSAIVAAVEEGREWSDISSETLGKPTQPNLEVLRSIEIVDGTVVLTLGGTAAIDGAQLVVVPGLTAAGDVVWTCGYNKPPSGVQLALEEHEKYSDVSPEYLPPECRS